jgi:aspartate kinase
LRGLCAKTPVVVVVSAMSGVTNRLVAAAQQAAEGKPNVAENLSVALREQHFTAAEVLVANEASYSELVVDLERIINEVASLCQGISLLRELTPRAHATVSSIGERLSARLMTATLRKLELNSTVVEATDVIVTTNSISRPNL